MSPENEMRHPCMPSRSPSECHSRQILDPAVHPRDRNIAVVGLDATISARMEESQKQTFKVSFTYSSGPFTAISDTARVSFANSLNPEPGNHSGICLTLCTSLVGGISQPETERTYRECVDEKCAGDYNTLETFHRVFCRLQEPVFVRLNIQTVRYLHDQRAGHT